MKEKKELEDWQKLSNQLKTGIIKREGLDILLNVYYDGQFVQTARAPISTHNIRPLGSKAGANTHQGRLDKSDDWENMGLDRIIMETASKKEIRVLTDFNVVLSRFNNYYRKVYSLPKGILPTKHDAREYFLGVYFLGIVGKSEKKRNWYPAKLEGYCFIDLGTLWEEGWGTDLTVNEKKDAWHYREIIVSLKRHIQWRHLYKPKIEPFIRQNTLLETLEGVFADG